ncbi:carbohydrate ABC transporter permease [Actinomadura sp. ATCC 39365]
MTGRLADLWERTVPWRWLTPSTLLIAGVVGFPALYMVYMSFLDISRIGLVRGMAGLDNYARLLKEDALGPVVGNTLLWLVIVVGLTMLLSLALAQFLSKPFYGRKFVRLALVVPWATSLVMTATVWRFIYEGGNGLLNRLLMDLSIISAPVDWYKDPATALYSIMAVGIITSMPFTTYVLLSGLQTVPHDVLEAARMDGASAWATWRRVTLPILRPSLMIAFVLNMLHVFNAFTVIWVIMGKTAGTHADTTVTWLYKIAFTAQLDSGRRPRSACSTWPSCCCSSWPSCWSCGRTATRRRARRLPRRRRKVPPRRLPGPPGRPWPRRAVRFPSGAAGRCWRGRAGGGRGSVPSRCRSSGSRWRCSSSPRTPRCCWDRSRPTPSCSPSRPTTCPGAGRGPTTPTCGGASRWPTTSGSA